jgi:hypothetical protein
MAVFPIWTADGPMQPEFDPRGANEKFITSR